MFLLPIYLDKYCYSQRLELAVNFYSSYVIEHEDSVFDVIQLTKGYNPVQQYTFKRSKAFYYNDNVRDYVLYYSKSVEYISALAQLSHFGIEPEYTV